MRKYDKAASTRENFTRSVNTWLDSSVCVVPHYISLGFVIVIGKVRQSSTVEETEEDMQVAESKTTIIALIHLSTYKNMEMSGEATTSVW